MPCRREQGDPACAFYWCMRLLEAGAHGGSISSIKVPVSFYAGQQEFRFRTEFVQ